ATAGIFDTGFRLALRRLVTAAGLDLQGQLEFAAGQIGNHQVRIDDVDVMIGDDVAGRDRACFGRVQVQLCLGTRVHAHGDVFHVEQNVDYVFLHAFDRGVLVQ